MSGIYIPGMELPENCICCDLSHEDGWCPAKQTYTDSYTFKTCPLVHVPPHGRLGDLDRLEQMFVDIDNAPYSGFDGEEPFYSAEDAAQIIRLAPTVIPAEPPKDESLDNSEPETKQEYYHAFCSRCGRPVIVKKEEAFWWPGGTTDDHLCISCDACGGLAEV